MLLHVSLTLAKQTRKVLTVGKYPNVKTLSRLVFPQAPSPMITSFLRMTFPFCCAIPS